MTNYSTLGKSHFSQWCRWVRVVFELSCVVGSGVNAWIWKRIVWGGGAETGMLLFARKVRSALQSSPTTPAPHPTCAREYTMVAFSASGNVCSAASIWILFKWESNGPDCSKTTPAMLTQTQVKHWWCLFSALWRASGNISFFIPFRCPPPSHVDANGTVNGDSVKALDVLLLNKCLQGN